MVLWSGVVNRSHLRDKRAECELVLIKMFEVCNEIPFLMERGMHVRSRYSSQLISPWLSTRQIKGDRYQLQERVGNYFFLIV
jgi:hypothetical protein